MKDFVKALIAEISFLDLSSHLQQFYSLFRHRERTLRERDKSLRQVPLLGQFLNVYFYFYTISSSCCNFNILEDGTNRAVVQFSSCGLALFIPDIGVRETSVYVAYSCFCETPTHSYSQGIT